jgi:hypothetical protein
MRGLRGKLSYANVTSTLCLFLLVSGGAAYAAAHLPKNSVTSTQIKPGSIQANDLSKGAKQKLSGKPGPIGVQGPAGPAGEPATKLWAVVDSDGTLRHGSGVVSVSGEPKNGTTVTFNRAVDNCAVIASVGRTGLGFTQGRVFADTGLEITGHKILDPNKVIAQTFGNEAEGPVSLGFNLAVFC